MCASYLLILITTSKVSLLNIEVDLVKLSMFYPWPLRLEQPWGVENFQSTVRKETGSRLRSLWKPKRWLAALG